MLRLEARPRSLWMSAASPVLALSITIVLGMLLFAALGKDPVRGMQMFFYEPFKSAYALSELGLKATPLVLIGLGLAVCFRANVWNIGAEGQYIMGATFAGGVALLAQADTGRWIVVVMVLAGTTGGLLWAAIAAWLRDRYNAGEILVSLMLVYVAQLVLGYLVYGPWKDPLGYNFPQTISFLPATQLPRLFEGLRVHVGAILALLLAGAGWLLLYRSHAGLQLQVSGAAPSAARYAGYSNRRILWGVLLGSGGLAGLAGALETAGPLGQLTPHVPAGYGFAAIIVAFVGRLHPVGVVFAGVLMSALYIGGELAQSRLALPKSITGVFQGLLLFTLLVCDTFTHHRVRWRRASSIPTVLARS